MTEEHGFLIMSYPRSGNHLLRGVVEYASHRPTLGCPGSRRDTPIYQRAPNQQAQVIQITRDQPIGYKAHTLNCVWQHTRASRRRLKTVLLLRRPVDAISSHLLRFLDSMYLSDKTLNREVERAISMYLEPVMFFRQTPAEERTLVRFEDLVALETGPLAAARVLAFMNLPPQTVRLQAPEWKAVAEVTRDSQESLGRVRDSRRKRVREAVAGKISENEVLRYLG